jgi:hypothetical protein
LENDPKSGQPDSNADENPLPSGDVAPAATEKGSAKILVNPTILQDNGNPDDAQGGNETNRAAQQEGSKPMSGFERQTLTVAWFGFAIGFLSVVAAIVAGFLIYEQFKEMNAQTNILDMTLKQTRADSASSSIATGVPGLKCASG